VSDEAPALAGEVLGDADAAGAALVALALAVPVELDDDAGVLVDVDLLARCADDGGGLGAVDDGARRGALGAEGDGVRDAGELVVVGGDAVGGVAGGVGDAVDELGEQVAGVALGAEVTLQVEAVTGCEGGAVTRAADADGGALFGLHAGPGDGVALAGLREAAGVFVDLELGAAADAGGAGGGGEQGHARLLEVVVIEGVGAGAQLALDAQVADVAGGGAGAALAGFVDGAGLAGARGVGGGGVEEDEVVGFFAVLEVVADAGVFEEAREEVEVALAVLDAEFALGVAAGELEFVVGEAELAEEFAGDVGDTHVLVYAAGDTAREDPEPGDELGAVGGEAAGAGAVLEARDDAVEPALAAIAEADGDAQGLAHDLGEGEIFALGEQLELAAEELGDGFARGHAQQQQGTLAERRADAAHSLFLGVRHGTPRLVGAGRAGG
jgi:hypothetical protein